MINNNTYVDLHIHSCYSDGTDSVEQIVQQSKNNNLGLISITDHDTLEGNHQLIKYAKKYNISYISGVEMSCKDDMGLFDLLGYDIDINNKELNDAAKSNRENRSLYDEEKLKEMSKDIKEIDIKEYSEWEYDKNLGLSKTLNYLLHKNIVSNMRESMSLFRKYKYDFKEIKKTSLKEAVNLIHNANGYAVLAHIGFNLDKNSSEIQIMEKLDYMRKLGIDGFECYHSKNWDYLQDIILKWCNTNNMIITGGSDYHSKSYASNGLGSQNIMFNMIDLKGINIY